MSFGTFIASPTVMKSIMTVTRVAVAAMFLLVSLNFASCSGGGDAKGTGGRGAGIANTGGTGTGGCTALPPATCAGGGTGGAGGNPQATDAGTGGCAALPPAPCTCQTTDPDGTAAQSEFAFCQYLENHCGRVASGGGLLPPAYVGNTACRATYSARTAAQKHCQSQRMCWGVLGNGNPAGADPATQCQHAWGAGDCAN